MARRRKLRWIWRGLGLLVVVGGGLLVGGYFYARGSLPQTDGELVVAGLTGEVEIVRDAHGVPHIRAGSTADALFGLGFVHAQDRLWQMEMNRRIGKGELAEVLGEGALGTDRFLRTLGVARAAEAAKAVYSEETLANFEAYTEGVNAFIEGHDGALPPEFLILGVEPEPWTMLDSLVWIKMMAWDLGANWNSELLRYQLRTWLTPEQISEFLPPYPGEAPVALPDLNEFYAGIELPAETMLAMAPETLPNGSGSNNWVVSGARTESGAPLLANDPHLGLSVPPIWYFAHLEAPDLNVIGVTLPGVPAVILGRNDRIAWGFTNTGPDVQDLYIERISETDPGSYITPEGTEPFKTREEVIKVKDADPVVMEVRETRHGPVISDVHEGMRGAVPSGHVLAFAWTALDPSDRTAESAWRIMTAGNWSEFRKALRDYHAPQQNMVYADVDGNIGFIAPARVPIRKPGNTIKGLAPVPGWDATYDWDGYIPFDELPQAYNPAGGYVVTANHKVVPEGYPYHITSEWTLPYRARRITEMLRESDAHTVESFETMQADVYSLMVEELRPLMLKAEVEGLAASGALSRLGEWDGRMSGDAPEPLIFAAWVREINRLVYADELGPLFERNWRQRPLFLKNVLSDKDGQSRWCDDITTEMAETCPEILGAALEAALADLKERYGDDESAWRWDEAHFAHHDHRPFTHVRGLREIFDVTRPSEGGTYTINVGRYSIGNEDEPFANRHAASFRAVYDLSDLDDSVFMLTTGQSGNRFSEHYDDLADSWSAVTYLPLSTDRADYEDERSTTLTLTPGDGG